MHGQIGGHEPDVIPFARTAKAALMGLINSTRQGKRFCNYSTERLALQRKTAGMRWIQHKNFRSS